MKSIEDRIKENVTRDLKHEIIELLKPICDRIELPEIPVRHFHIDFGKDKVHWSYVIQKIEELIFAQEIDCKVDAAIEEFMNKVNNAEKYACESCCTVKSGVAWREGTEQYECEECHQVWQKDNE